MWLEDMRRTFMPAQLGTEVSTMEQAHTSWVAKTWAFPRKVVTAGVAQAKKRHRQLTNRYGARYTYAMVVVMLIVVYLPIPGIVLGSVALGIIAAVAEVHRAISKRRESGIKEHTPMVETKQWPSRTLWNQLLPNVVAATSTSRPRWTSTRTMRSGLR